MKVGDKVYIKNQDSIGTIIKIKGDTIQVKTNTGRIIHTLEQFIIIIDVAQTLWDKIKLLFKSIFKK